MVNVLLIEDNPADARLFREHLRDAAAPGQFEIRVAPTLTEGLAQIKETNPKVVFLDLGLPDSQGLETYQVLRRAQPNVPVIIFSGTRDEELAVQAVQAGAQDYLFKGETTGTLIMRAARYAVERAKSERVVLESEAALRKAQAVAHVGSWVWRIRENRLEWSDEMFRIFGVDKAGFSGNLNDIVAGAIHPDDRAAVEASNLSVARDGEPVPLEYRVVWPDGTVRTVWAEAGELVRDSAGRPETLSGIVQDITERKRTADALMFSELRYRRLFESAKDGILILDAETGLIEDVNPYLTGLLGFSHGQITDKYVWELGFLRDIIANRENFLKLRREDYIRYDDLPLETADGRKIEVEFVSNVYTEDNHRVIQCNIRDITGRKRAEKEIGSLARFPAENPSPVLRIDRDGLLAYANPAAHRFIGGKMEIGKKAPELLGKIAAEALEDKREKRIETECGERIFLFIATPLGDAEYVNLYGLDITERKKAETALRALAVRFETLLAAVPEIVMEVDTRKVYTWANQAGLDFFGEDVVGREASFYFEGEQDTYAAVQALFDGARDDASLESIQRRRDGESRLLAWHCRALRDESGRTTGALSSARDITHEKQMQLEILKLNAELEQRVEERTAQLQAANRELEAFSYSVSHDLRAPLRAIDGFTGILLEDHENALDEEGKRVCGVIRDNACRMGHLIDDLLGFSRLGRTSLSKTRIDMKKTAAQAFEEAVPPEGRARIDFSIGDLPPARCDLQMIRQVWANLLSNAVKFTSRRPRAAIAVTGEASGNEAVYRVRDNGAGFDMEYVDKLFGVFQRLHGRKEFDGTGVGLAIVKRIVERHGGRVWAEAETDKGAVFSFSLPLETVHEGGTTDA
ncbi:MAG: PAS domain S-box protein [Spirochaetales bacterium]|nr:PAS domain S-box protein [Spirochaetales bacterium]